MSTEEQRLSSLSDELTDKEKEAIIELKKYLKSGIEYIEFIENNEDLEENLGYLIHDWYKGLDKKRRNEILEKHLEVLDKLFRKIRGF